MEGQLVEVSRDKVVWYSASILKCPPKSSSKRRKKAFVEFKTLYADDGFSLLREYVDPTFIRPPPPGDYSANGVFKENDIVDAKYKAGWWAGVVKILLPGRRYIIYFEILSDALDFDAQELRLHWDWADGVWIPPNLPQITGSAFSSGTVVEVNLDRENVHDAWFQAVVIRKNGDQNYFVKRIGPNNDDRGALKVTVDSLHIRPIPPHYADRDYEMLDKVDVPYDFGWRAGVIIKLLAGRRYNVFFKHENEVKELGHSEIRPHADWLDGKWVTTSQGEVVVSQEQLGVAQSGNENPEVNLQHENPCAAKDNTVEENPSTWRMTEHDMLKSGGGGGQEKKRKRGRPHKIVGEALEVSVAGMEVHVAGDIADEMAVEDHTSNGRELSVQLVVESEVAESEPRENTGVSDKGGMIKDTDKAFAGVTKHLDETRERHVVPLESCSVNSSLAGNQIQITPLIKKSPVWKTIETLEVFQTVPQNPHFHPLSLSTEDYREVTAIGLMYTYAHLVENICSLQFEDPRSILDLHLEILVDLEKHGFDVVMIRDRVNELLSMKDMEEEALNELKDAETQVREQTVVRSDFEKKIMELQKELAAAKSKVEAKDHEISELQTRADAANRRINNARRDFKKIVTAPWKMP